MICTNLPSIMYRVSWTSILSIGCLSYHLSSEQHLLHFRSAPSPKWHSWLNTSEASLLLSLKLAAFPSIVTWSLWWLAFLPPSLAPGFRWVAWGDLAGCWVGRCVGLLLGSVLGLPCSLKVAPYVMSFLP